MAFKFGGGCSCCGGCKIHENTSFSMGTSLDKYAFSNDTWYLKPYEGTDDEDPALLACSVPNEKITLSSDGRSLELYANIMFSGVQEGDSIRFHFHNDYITATVVEYQESLEDEDPQTPAQWSYLAVQITNSLNLYETIIEMPNSYGQPADGNWSAEFALGFANDDVREASGLSISQLFLAQGSIPWYDNQIVAPYWSYEKGKYSPPYNPSVAYAGYDDNEKWKFKQCHTQANKSSTIQSVNTRAPVFNAPIDTKYDSQLLGWEMPSNTKDFSFEILQGEDNIFIKDVYFGFRSVQKNAKGQCFDNDGLTGQVSGIKHHCPCVECNCLSLNAGTFAPSVYLHFPAVEDKKTSYFIAKNIASETAQCNQYNQNARQVILAYLATKIGTFITNEQYQRFVGEINGTCFCSNPCGVGWIPLSCWPTVDLWNVPFEDLYNPEVDCLPWCCDVSNNAYTRIEAGMPSWVDIITSGVAVGQFQLPQDWTAKCCNELVEYEYTGICSQHPEVVELVNLKNQTMPHYGWGNYIYLQNEMGGYCGYISALIETEVNNEVPWAFNEVGTQGNNDEDGDGIIDTPCVVVSTHHNGTFPNTAQTKVQYYARQEMEATLAGVYETNTSEIDWNNFGWNNAISCVDPGAVHKVVIKAGVYMSTACEWGHNGFTYNPNFGWFSNNFTNTFCSVTATGQACYVSEVSGIPYKGEWGRYNNHYPGGWGSYLGGYPWGSWWYGWQDGYEPPEDFYISSCGPSCFTYPTGWGAPHPATQDTLCSDTHSNPRNGNFEISLSINNN